MKPQIFPLRIKTASGSMTIDTLYENSTVAEFKEAILKYAGIEPKKLVVRRGYPPTPLDLTNEDKTIAEVITNPKEMLIIEGPLAGACSNPLPSQPQPSTSSGPTARFLQPPFSSSRSSTTRSIKPTEPVPLSVPSSKGILMRRVVPANNSCLFTSINFCLTNGRYEEQSGIDLRKIIAKAVASDPITYNEAFLGKPNPDYVTWILNDTHWGGAIEISILSAHYSIEIVVVDTQNARLNRFGEDKDYANRILIVYDGIHYDPLLMEPLRYSTKIQTIFPKSEEIVLSMALELAQEAKKSRQFTDVQHFTLRCLDCQMALQGQEGARLHAKETGHINFGEF